jgi:glycosyltransferase involved in cell wall biosynthesis
VWLAAINPYYAERLSALARLGRVPFEVWLSRWRSPERHWQVGTSDLEFPYFITPSLALGERRIGIPLRRYMAVRPRVLLTFHADPAVALAGVQSLLPGRRLMYYVERTFDEFSHRTAIKERAKRVLFSRAARLLTPGPDADDYVASYGVSREKIGRLNHVLDLSRYDLAYALRTGPDRNALRAGLGLHGFVFLYVGRLSSNKGVDSLLQAMALLRDADTQHRLLLVGESDPSIDVGRLIESLGLQERVIVHGFTPQASLARYYAAADAFVFPTLGDTYGLVIDEAQASGLPVISTSRVWELAERVQPGLSGLITNPSEASGLARAMAQLASEPEKARRMGLNGRSTASFRTLELWVSQVEDAVGRV